MRKKKIKTFVKTAFVGVNLKLIEYEYFHIPTKQWEYGPAGDHNLILDYLVGAYILRAIQSD